MGKSALITGAAKRIGEDIAFSLAEKGYSLALHYNSSKDKALDLCNTLTNRGIDCYTFPCDLSDEKDLLGLIPRVKEKFPSLDLLVNNASVFQRSPLTETELDLFNNNLNTNFKAPFFLSRDFARCFKKGHIINILDSKVAHNDQNYIAYTLSKKALADLTMLSALELVPDIRVNGIAPGYILPPEGVDQLYLEKRIKKIPLQRVGKTQYITTALNFLLDHEFITGQILYIDGGEHL